MKIQVEKFVAYFKSIIIHHKKQVQVVFLGFVATIAIIVFSTQSRENHDANEHADHAAGEGDEHAGHDHDEDEVEIVESSEIAQELAKISTAKVEPKEIHRVVHLNGRIFPNQNKTASINARYSGVVKNVYKELGDRVEPGERLASIEANGSLSVFSVTSKIAGTIIKKEIVTGEFVTDKNMLFEVSNLSDVWVDMNVTEQDFGDVKVGQPVRIQMWDHQDTVDAMTSYVSPLIHPDSQTTLVRSVIDNKSGVWRPGSFITAELTVESLLSEVAVEINAIQLVEDRYVVFVKVRDDAFEVRTIKPGTYGSRYVAVVAGLRAGEEYVSKNSFVLKAEHLKSLAGHDHSH